MHSLPTIAALSTAAETLNRTAGKAKRRMRRPPPLSPDDRVIEIETTPQVVALLDELAASGLYPPTREGAAEEVLRAALREIEMPVRKARR
ncbi:MAG: hypothetical protein ACJ79R_22200 [Anaeromyxobacteraceae bacterium]